MVISVTTQAGAAQPEPPAVVVIFEDSASALPQTQIREAIAPGPELLFADALRIVDVHLAEADLTVSDCFNLYFFTKRHPVAGQIHFLQCIPPEHPHTRLRIADPSQEKDRHDEGKHAVADLVLETHRGIRECRQARSRDPRRGGGASIPRRRCAASRARTARRSTAAARAALPARRRR